jgi:hypothetical protein
VVDAPLIVTVEVPEFSDEPAPDVFQLPLTVQAPVVNVRVPEVPPFIVTFETAVAEAFATRRPALPIASAPPVRLRLLVWRVVVPLPPWTVRVPAQPRALTAIVNVTVEAPLLNVRLLNSAALDGRAAKVIVWADDDVKVTVAVPIDQLADVEPFVHEPLTVQDSEPNAMYEAAEEIVTFPMIATAPEVEVSAPPDIVRPAFAVSPFVPFASVPPDRVRSPPAVSWLRRVRVPPLIVRVPNEAPAAIVRFPVAENVTVELVAVKVAVEVVFQLPVLIVMVAEANVIVAGPLAVKLLAPNATGPALVRVRVPLHVREPLKVVAIPGFTVRLFTVCEMLIVPPDALTTTEEVPTVNVPRWVSIEVTVMVEALAASAPPGFTFNVTALTAKFAPLVFRVVVPAPPATVKVPPVLKAFVDIVKTTVAAPELKVTLPPNSCTTLAKVIVCEAAELKVMGAAKFHEAEVVEFVQDPETVHEPPPVEVMYPAGLFTLTSAATETVDAFVWRIPVAPLTVIPPPTVRL